MKLTVPPFAVKLVTVMFPLTVLVPLDALQVPVPLTEVKLSPPVPPDSVPVTVVAPLTVRAFPAIERVPAWTLRVVTIHGPAAATVPPEFTWAVAKV